MKKQPFEPNPHCLSMFQIIALANEHGSLLQPPSLAPDVPQDVPTLCSWLRADGEPRRSIRRSGSRSELHGLAPELDSDYSNDQAKLPLRSARLEVDVRRAGVSMDLGPTRRCLLPTSIIFLTVVLGCLGTYSLTFWLEAGLMEM